MRKRRNRKITGIRRIPAQNNRPLMEDRAAKPAVGRELANAFLTFTQAAGSLEKSYTQLQGEVVRLRGELARANAELDHSLEENSRVRAHLAKVLEKLPCGVVVADGAAKAVRLINPEAKRLLEIPAEWHGDSDGLSRPMLAKLLARRPNGTDGREEDWSVGEGDAGRSIGVSSAPASGTAGEPEETIWILRDLTEQKRAACERERAQQSLALAEMTTLLAHEIRNPLGSMELFTGLLEEAVATTPETRQWVNHLRAGLRSLSATVNNVLQFHSQSGLHLAPVGIDRLLGEVTEFLLPVARQRGQQIDYENRIGKVNVPADASRLKQVFLNLALNAFRAMLPGGALCIRLMWAPQYPGGLVRIEMQDEGRGIPPELLEKIFDAGFTTTPGSPGLGLAVSKRIVEQHGGVLEVQSKVKEGTQFAIVLPVAGESA
ncbi:MAG TPA: ATP-binding protein [Dongiaceae bacterium]|nr:ATP-binding protein [Dongiaceae bacterium]